MTVPFGQMTQQQFNEMVQQAMPLFANNPDGMGGQQEARDHVARQLAAQEGRPGSTAYRPQVAQQQQPQQQQPMQGMDGQFPARPVVDAPVPQPRPEQPGDIDAMINAQIGDDNFTGGTANATPSLGGGPANPMPQPPADLPPEMAAAIQEEVAREATVPADDASLTRTNDIPQPQELIDDAAVGDNDERSRTLELVGIVAAGAAGIEGARRFARLLREGNEAALSFARENGVDPHRFADELDLAYERGGRTRGMPGQSVAPIYEGAQDQPKTAPKPRVKTP